MAEPLSQDLRIRIIDAWKQQELTWDELAERFSVGRATVDRLIALYRATGSVAPRPRGGGYPPKIPDEKLPVLEAVLRAHPDATLPELVELYEKASGDRVSTMTIGRGCVRLGFTRKKRPSFRRSGSDLPSRRSGRTSSRK